MNRRSLVIVLTLLCGVVLAGNAARAGQARQQAPSSAERLLRGAIDIHVHSLPDDRPRSVDGVEAAIQAKAKGMRAIVLKNHYESSAGPVYLVRKAVPGIEVFGGIDLNLTVGGMNPHAVEHMTKVTGGFGRIVWMSTFDAENAVRTANENRPFVRVSRSGELLPETKAVIGMIARYNLVLATGHVSAQEVMLLLREARRQGVRRMVVTHAMNPPISMTVPQMREAAREGAFIEFVGSAIRTADDQARMDRFADAIKQIGAGVTILSSDLGQQGNALPADGFAVFLGAIRDRGISEADIAVMTKQNPATLLDLR
jgi:hypothetical protein